MRTFTLSTTYPKPLLAPVASLSLTFLRVAPLRMHSALDLLFLTQNPLNVQTSVGEEPEGLLQTCVPNTVVLTEAWTALRLRLRTGWIASEDWPGSHLAMRSRPFKRTNSRCLRLRLDLGRLYARPAGRAITVSHKAHRRSTILPCPVQCWC